MNKKPKAAPGTFKRVIKMLFQSYPVLIPITIVCILFSSITAAIPAIFLEKVIAIIDKWQASGDWANAKNEIIPKVMLLVVFYVISIIAITLYTQLMAYITQGFLQKSRGSKPLLLF